MPTNVLDFGKRLKGFITAKRHRLERLRNTHPSDRGVTSLNLIREFPLYRANMDGSYRLKAQIASQSINNTIPFLSQLCEGLGLPLMTVISIEAFAKDETTRAASLSLGDCFNRHGSDKSSLHDYHWLYGSILQHPEAISSILEIGLGTNNPSVPSNMGVDGKPGASLRSWKDYCKNAVIYGADIDRNILFQEERIETYLVDQTDHASFASLAAKIPERLDLIVDDGLHAVDANVQTLSFALQRLKPLGWVVIEDIAIASQPLWQLVAALLPSTFQSAFIIAKNGCLFAVQYRP